MTLSKDRYGPPIHIRLTRIQLRLLAPICVDEDRNMSQVVRRAVDYYLRSLQLRKATKRAS